MNRSDYESYDIIDYMAEVLNVLVNIQLRLSEILEEVRNE